MKGREMSQGKRLLRLTALTTAAALWAFWAPGVLGGADGGDEVATENTKVIVDFSDPAEISRWRSVNDEVMGGVSSGGIKAVDPTAVFEGTISLENNGGFASVRTASRDFALAGVEGFIIRVRGDGKDYKLTARTDDAFDGVMYQATFETEEGQWREIRIPLADFTPTYHGRVLPDRPPLDGGKVRGIGFLISDAQEGPFRLEIAAVKAFSAASAPEAP
jgi:NADH dehydrogenase [ubiquinone] 1 alpha subcomplex assembly factor 1